VESKFTYRRRAVNGKEKQDQFGLGWLDYHARQVDPALRRMWAVDPHAFKYVMLSPYAYVANNPILFIDPTGMDIDLGNLYAKDKEGNYLYKRQILAFEHFAATKTGGEFLGQRAQEGFELKGTLVKGLNFKAEQAGKLSSKVDANFQVTDLDKYKITKKVVGGADGLTEAEITDKGKLSVTYHMHSERSSFFEHYNLKTEVGAIGLLSSVDTWAHETLTHGHGKEQNFLNGKYMGIKGKLRHSGGLEHKIGFVRPSPYYKNVHSMLVGINNKLKLGISNDYIWDKIIFGGYAD